MYSTASGLESRIFFNTVNVEGLVNNCTSAALRNQLERRAPFASVVLDASGELSRYFWKDALLKRLGVMKTQVSKQQV